ncbi:hypothetical protein Ae201684P_012022 [Aphanomyces euteiches]|nr:hypothetical protein Ae201684P_012022 [Aphanomyces euteiches]
MTCPKTSIAFLLNDSVVRDENWSRKCKTDGCFNYATSKGLCIRHGGGKRCGVTGCPAGAKHYGLCWRHGGSKTCNAEGCTKPMCSSRLYENGPEKWTLLGPRRRQTLSRGRL